MVMRDLNFVLENVGTSTPSVSLEKYSPINGELLYKVPITSEVEVYQLFSNIHSRQDTFQSLGVVKAAQILLSVCGELIGKKDEINHIVFLETGKTESLIEGEFETAKNFMIALAGLSQFQNGKVIPSVNPKKLVYSKNQPYGTAALITSHNTPLPNYAWKLAPSFLSLNSSILKPSEFTSLSAQKFVECFIAAGVPEYMVNLIHGGPSTVLDLLMEQPELVSFTGSFETGLRIKELTHSYSPKLILEMGGSNPMIICPTADFDLAAEAIVNSAFSNSGQRCASASRLIIHHEVANQVLKLIREKTLELVSKAPSGNFSGYLISDQAKKKHAEFIQKSQSAGALIEEFVSQKIPEGWAVSPTIIIDEGKKIEASTPEIFSPLIIVEMYENIEHALLRANNSRFALTAAIWTKDMEEAEEISQKLKAGIVNINGPTHGAEFQFPFGGQKNSGNGTKEVGINCLMEYSFEKVITSSFSK
jgi:acyl-CoA reductase-like NAD-dependent aldehyde dehydrogenase